MSVNNNVFLIGRLTAQPELKFLPGNGTAVTNFTLAVNRGFKKEDGTTDADFINVVAWGNTAKAIAENLDKGRMIAVQGSIQTRKYQDKNGQNRVAFEVVASAVQFLDFVKKGEGTAQNNNGFNEVKNSEDLPF